MMPSKRAHYRAQLKANIWKMYVFQILSWFMIMLPIVVLFYQEQGLNMFQVIILQAVFSIVVFITEIPSGYLADRIGRKKSIIIGATLGALGLGIFSLSHSFWELLVAEIILGIAAGFISGADSALLYDSLLEIHDEDRYQAIQGKYSALGNFSEGMAGILGGFLALISLRTPVIAQTAIYFLAIPVALSLKEPARHVYAIAEGNMKGMADTVKYALHKNKEVKWLVLYSAFIGTSTFTAVWFIQPIWKETGVPLELFGVLWAMLQFTAGIFSILAHHFSKKIELKWLLTLLFAMSTGAYIVLGLFQGIWMSTLFFLFYIVRGLKTPIINDALNKRIPSHRRATILSIQSLCMRLSFVFIGPYIGWIADIWTFSEAFLMAAIIFAALGFTVFIGLKKQKVI